MPPSDDDEELIREALEDDEEDDLGDESDESLIAEALEEDAAEEPAPHVPDQQPERAWYDELPDMALSAVQGAAFNLVDELAGPVDYAGQALKGALFGDRPGDRNPYGSLGEAYGANRSAMNATVKNNPWSHVAGQVGTAIGASTLGAPTVLSQSAIGAGHGALMELGGERSLVGGAMRAGGGAVGGALGGYLGSAARTSYPLPLPGRPIAWTNDDLRRLYLAEGNALPPPAPLPTPRSSAEMAQHAGDAERALGAYHPPPPSGLPEDPFLRGAQSLMPEEAGYLSQAPPQTMRPSVRDYELVPETAISPTVERGYMTAQDMAGGVPMRPHGSAPRTFTSEMVPEPPADPIMRGRAQYEIEPQQPEPNILRRDVRRAEPVREVPVEGPLGRGPGGRFLPRQMREVGGERIEPPYEGPLSPPPPEPPPSMVPGEISASRAPQGPVDALDFDVPPQHYLLQASGRSRAPAGPVEPIDVPPPLPPAGRAPVPSSQPWLADDWTLGPQSDVPMPPSRRPLQMPQRPTEPWLDDPATHERLVRQLEGQTSLPPAVPHSGGLGYTVGRDITSIAPRWARRATSLLEQHGVLPPTGKDLIERGLALPNEVAGRRMSAATMGAYTAASGGTDRVARGQDAVAYADAPALHYALSETLSSGDTGLSQEDQEALTSAVVRGDDQAIAAIDFKLRQRVPGYARRVERALRQLNEED